MLTDPHWSPRASISARSRRCHTGDFHPAFLDFGARYMEAMHEGTSDPALRKVVEGRGGDATRMRFFAIGERCHLPARGDEDRS